MESILSINDVVKQYGDYYAVNHLSFDVPRGSIFGLLGPNGAGKTSLIRIITGITMADSGQVLLDGVPTDHTVPAHIGYMPEERGLYKKMKVADHLMYLAQLRGMSKSKAKENIKYWFNRLDIDTWWNKKIDDLSKGMQQKVQFIATVAHEPKLLILDEPFSGLDPINANLIKDEIYRLNNEGTSVIFSTHRMEQVEEICEDIILINKGTKILSGNLSEVKEQFKKHQFEIGYYGELPSSFSDKFSVFDPQKDRVSIQMGNLTDPNTLIREVLDTGLQLKSFKEILPSINDIFIDQVGGSYNPKIES